MYQPLLSIIVPVYNAEDYIEQCIRSVMHQSFENYELILVNDGSTDKSFEKCMEWQNDRRLQIISIDNQGVSHARNVGMKRAKGKWLMFLDSDDYLVENALENIIRYTELGIKEISGLYQEEKEGTKKIEHKEYEIVNSDKVAEMALDSINNHFLPSFYEIKESTLMGCWGKLYLREVVEKNQLEFHEDLRLSEDLVFHLEYLSHIDRVLVTNVPVFVYRQHSMSVTKKFNSSYFEDRMHLFEELMHFPYQIETIAVHIVSTLFLFVCQLEKNGDCNTRKKLEKKVSGFLNENRMLLSMIKGKGLSRGKWQKIVYKIVFYCFFYRMNWLSFKILKIYTMIAKGN